VVNQDAVQRMAATSRPKTSSGVSSYDLQNAARSVQSASERPVRTHQIAQGVQGARLDSGSMRAKPSGTAVQSQSYLPRQPPQVVDPNSPNAVYDPSTRKFIHKQDAMARHRELHEEPEPARQYVSPHMDSFHSVHIPENQMGRGSPSPVRHYVRQEQPAPPRREESTPHVETTTRSAPYPGTGSVPRYSDDFEDVYVQPHEQANTGCKLEDSGYGTIAGQKEDVSSPIVAANQDSAYPRLLPPTNTLVAGQGRGSIRAGHDRHASLSPPRSAHFASVAVELTGLKHDPLPRSVSPAKSALKSSPSVSRRGESPMAPNGRHHSLTASSEVSDATSEEGGRKKKKNVRVSFEEEPVIAGTAAYANTQAGLNQSKWSPIVEKEDEFEDYMKPRAALPVFGSIRDKERRPHKDMAEKVTETVPSTSSAPESTTRGSTQVFTDVATGNIVAHDHAYKQSIPSNPLPPEVTTVEGSGYVSDSASEYSDTHKQIEHTELLPQPPAPEPKSLSVPTDATSPTAPITERVVEVPNIALQPATPSPYERAEPKFQSMAIPGGWGDDVHEPKSQAYASSQTIPSQLTSAPSVETIRQHPQPIVHAEEDDTTDDNSSVYSDAYEDLSDGEGGFGSINALMSGPVAPSSTDLMHSTYADKSATDSPTAKLRLEVFADDEQDSTPTPTQDWNAAEQHWSGLSASLKQPQQAEAPTEWVSHAQETIARVLQAPVAAPASISSEYSSETTPERKVKAIPPPKVTTPSATQKTGKPLKSALKKSPAPQPARQAERQIRTTTRSAAPRESLASDIPQMKKTMRGGPNPTSQAVPQMGSTMRSSMRGTPDTTSRAQPQMRKSMRSAGTSPATSMGLAASRHSMVPMETKPPRGALQKKKLPPAAGAPRARPQSMPAARQIAAPVPTYDSDSDASASSFQRTRRGGSRDQGGRYTMRGSMRQEPAPTMRANASAPRQVRAILPPRAISPAMHSSMRPSSPTQEPVKSSKFSMRSLSPMGRFRKGGSEVRPSSPPQPKPMPTFNKHPKPSKEKVPAVKPAKAAFSSRFADSSDDDDDHQPRRFQSRFDDSDDDESLDYKLPPGLTPVRGIPRKAGEEDGDSTDLEEEADDESPNVTARPATAPNGTNGQANGQGAALSAGSLRDSKHAPALPSFEAGDKKKKRGFFGLGKKKNTTPQSEPAQTQTASVQAVSVPVEIPMPPTQRNRDMGLPMTPIDEGKEFGDPVPISPVSKKSPKLQRRSTPEWPLPPVPAIGTDDRPVSSDGVAPRRPRFANRQSSVLSNISAPVVDAQGRSVSYGRSGKKKKFQGLRRVFGLND
jgi:serine/arginine repetitive matrix protein 2